MAPLIHEYTADAGLGEPMTTRQARPSDSGNVGNAITQFANTAERGNEYVLKREGQAEVTDLDAKLANFHAERTNALNQKALTSDPNDKNFSSDYMDETDQKLADIGDNISTPEGRVYFTKASSLMRSSFLVHSVGKQAALAGESAANDIQTQQDSYSSSVYSEPGRLEEVKDLHALGIQAKVENKMITPEQGDTLRAQADRKFTLNAAQGYLRNALSEPDETRAKGQIQFVRDQIKKGTWNDELNGDDKAKVMHEADQTERGWDAQNKSEDSAARIEQRKKSAQFMDDQYLKIQNGTFNAKDVLNAHNDLMGDPEAFQKRDALIRKAQEVATNKVMKPDPKVLSDTIEGIHDGTIRNADQIGSIPGLGIKGENLARAEFKAFNGTDLKDENTLLKTFMDNVKKGMRVSSDPNVKDPQGDAAYAEWQSRFLPQYRDNAKNMNPYDLLTPGRPSYMGYMVPAPRSTEEVFKSMYAPSAPQAPVSGTPSGGVSTPPLGDIGKMDLSSLQKLDPKSLSPEQRKSAKARWDELNK